MTEEQIECTHDKAKQVFQRRGEHWRYVLRCHLCNAHMGATAWFGGNNQSKTGRALEQLRQ